MLKKSWRLTTKKDIERTAKTGWRKTIGDVKIFFLPQTTLKMTVVVPAQVSKKAVRRNRIKRLARETFRLNLPRLPVGWWLIKPQTGSFEMTYEKWQQFWSEIIKLVPKSHSNFIFRHSRPRSQSRAGCGGNPSDKPVAKNLLPRP